MHNTTSASATVTTTLLTAIAAVALTGGCLDSVPSSGSGGSGGSLGSSSSSAVTSGTGGSTTASSSGSGGSSASSSGSGGSSASSSGSGGSSASSSSSSSGGTGGAAGAGGSGGAAADATLLVHYTFDEGANTTAHDSSGHHHDATLEGSAEWTAQGHIGGAVSLQGADPRVRLPENLLDAYNVVTIATWVKLSSLDTWSRIFDFGGNGSAFMFLTPMEGAGTMRLSVFKTEGGVNREAILTTPSLLPTGVWKHVLVKFTLTGYELWIDGILTGFVPALAPNDVKVSELAPTPTNWIGKSQFPDPPLHGEIDDFRIYTRALTDVEIAALAAQ
jgi:concanavalin A-like lectin/glucanase superfamily protein